MDITKKRLNKYYREIRRRLKCPRHTRQNIMKIVKWSIEDYTSSIDIKSMEEIYKEFGTPAEVAEYHLEQLDKSAIRQYKKKVSIYSLLMVIITVIILVISALVIKAKSFSVYHSGPNIGTSFNSENL